MKQFLLAVVLLSLICGSRTGWAQPNPKSEQNRCGSAFEIEKLKKYHPDIYQKWLRIEQHTQNYIKGKQRTTEQPTSQRVTDPQVTITIPVVVHVVYNTAQQNISDAQIQSQIDVLNEDFRRRNSDASLTPSPFSGVASDVNIEFKLACIAPNGTVTTGIERAFTNTSEFVFSAPGNIPNEQAIGVKFVPGAAAWPADKYLNIWTCNLVGGASGVLGYARFPGTAAANVDGVVIRYNSMGRVGTLAAPYDKGRTATHEVGHWLNLIHISGDASCGNDLVNDTPTQQEQNYNCRSFPYVTCSNGPNGDMFMNYMDYSDDACMNLFTNGQKDRMRALFVAGGFRESFISAKIQQQAPQVCGNGPFVFSVAANVGASVNYNWTVTAPLQIISGQGTNQITCSKSYNEFATVTVSANGFCDSKTVQVGDGSFSFNSSASYYGYVCPGMPVSFTVDRTNQRVAESYTWSVNGIPSSNSGSSFQITGPQPGQSDYVRVVVNNDCDGQYEFGQMIYGASEIDGLPCQNVRIGAEVCVAAYPNPADAVLTLEQAAGAVSTIYNSQGQLVYTAKRGKHTAIIDTRAWPAGFYYLLTQTNKQVERCRLQIAHP